jgi:hypothetical protein
MLWSGAPSPLSLPTFLEGDTSTLRRRLVGCLFFVPGCCPWHAPPEVQLERSESSRISWGFNQPPPKWPPNNGVNPDEQLQNMEGNSWKSHGCGPRVGSNWRELAQKLVRRASMRAPAVGTARCAKTPWHWNTVTSWTKLNDSRDQNDVRMMKCSSTSGYTRKITRIIINFQIPPYPWNEEVQYSTRGVCFFLYKTSHLIR